jgi:pimeloyl-ACP methyl ester carboxylesterase
MYQPMAGIREERLELAGFETRSLTSPASGDTRDPVFLLLHGYSDSADTWRPLMELLEAGGGRTAIAVDMPGFGQAARLARDRPILPQLDRFAVAAIEHAAASGCGEVIVVGNSLGGCVAMRSAQRNDLPLAGIVPIAPAGLDMAAWIAIIEGAWAVQAVLRSPLPLPEIVVRGLVGRTYRRLASAHPQDVADEVVAAFTRSFASKRDVVRLLGTGRSLRPELRDPFQLDWIRCPVLVIWGERDRMVPPSGAQRLLDELPDARLEVIEDCGHCPQIECPEAVAELLERFPAPIAQSLAG